MTDLEAAARFIWLHARLIDRHRFAHLFLDADADPVVRTLRGYQNADGGFGHALEPDLRTPTSQPGHGYHALEFLAEAGAFHDAMVTGACDFLMSVTRPDGGVPFVLATALEHPRAPWWQPADASSLIQTAASAAVLHAHGARHPWLDGATEYCWTEIGRLTFDRGYDALFAVRFLDAVPEADRAVDALDAIRPDLLASGLVRLDPDAGGEAHTPLDFSPWPGARSRRLFPADLVERHLEGLAGGQQEDGGWTFAWPAWSPAAALEWRGFVTVEALRVLRANGRLSVPVGSHR
jgi:hypothetical protein